MVKSFAFVGDTYVGTIISRKLQAAGFVLAQDLASADCVLSYCLSTTMLEDCYLASGGAIESAREGCVLVDLSPSTSTFAKEIYAVARVNELQAVDAPLVVLDYEKAPAFADSASLLVLAGGEEVAYAEVKELLEVLADKVSLLGGPGSGQLAKCSATMMQASGLVSLVESYALARREGDSAQELVDTLIALGTLSPQVGSLYHAIEHGHFKDGYPCHALMADLTAALVQADESELVLPQLEACQHLLELIVVVGGGTLPAAALALAYASDEEGAAHGLDWAKADRLYEHQHDHEHDHDDYDYDYGFEDEQDGGFGSFSAN